MNEPKITTPKVTRTSTHPDQKLGEVASHSKLDQTRELPQIQKQQKIPAPTSVGCVSVTEQPPCPDPRFLPVHLERLLFVLGYRRGAIPGSTTQLMYFKVGTKVAGGTSMIPLRIDWHMPASEVDVLGLQRQLDLAGVLSADQFMDRLEAARNDVNRTHQVRVPSQDAHIKTMANAKAGELGLELGEHHELSDSSDGFGTMPTLVLEYFVDSKPPSSQVLDFELQIYHAVWQEPGGNHIAVQIRRKS